MQKITLQMEISGESLSSERISEELEIASMKILTGQIRGVVTDMQGERIGGWAFTVKETP